METMVIIPNDGLYKERQWAEMTLMGNGCNKLQKKPNLSISWQQKSEYI